MEWVSSQPISSVGKVSAFNCSQSSAVSGQHQQVKRSPPIEYCYLWLQFLFTKGILSPPEKQRARARAQAQQAVELVLFQDCVSWQLRTGDRCFSVEHETHGRQLPVLAILLGTSWQIISSWEEWTAFRIWASLHCLLGGVPTRHGPNEALLLQERPTLFSFHSNSPREGGIWAQVLPLGETFWSKLNGVSLSPPSANVPQSQNFSPKNRTFKSFSVRSPPNSSWITVGVWPALRL